MNRIQSVIYCILALIASASFAYAQTAESIAKALEAKFAAGDGVSMSFTTTQQGKITITASNKSGKLRIESPTMLIVTDGHTVWNTSKIQKKVTIDALSSGSALGNPTELYHFSTGYTSTLVSSNVKESTLELTPDKHIADMLKPIGDVQKFLFVVTNPKKNPAIKHASAVIGGQTSDADQVSIKSVKKLDEKQFTFKPSSDMKVIDLRE